MTYIGGHFSSGTILKSKIEGFLLFLAHLYAIAIKTLSKNSKNFPENNFKEKRIKNSETLK